MTNTIGTAATIDPSVQCPSCSGYYLRNHPDSPIMFRHTNTCDIRSQMDGRYVGDLALIDSGFTGRYATLLELELLAATGVTATELTHVMFLAPGAYRFNVRTTDDDLPDTVEWPTPYLYANKKRG